jgi:hypothetical protein
MVDLAKGESFSFLGFEYRRIRSRNRVWRPAPTKYAMFGIVISAPV